MRWNKAKYFKLCYRYLAKGHRGKSNERSRPCDQGDYQKLHHRLLHRNKRQTKERMKRKFFDRLCNETDNCKLGEGYRAQDCSTADATFPTRKGSN